jgi:hypothetical protein
MMLLAALAGMCFSLMGFAYRLGTGRGVSAIHILGVCGVVGAAVFGARALTGVGGAPPLVLGLAAVAGVTQYATARLLRTAIRLGPLSPLWCVLMLGFIPVTAYAYVALGEAPSAFQYAAVAAGVGCVLAASLTQRAAPGAQGGAPAQEPHRLRYAALLVGLLLFNSVSNICVKELATRPDGQGGTLMARFHDVFLAVLYVGIAASVAVRQVAAREPLPPWRWTLLLGGMAAAGSVAGMSLLVRCAALPAAMVFTVNSVASILFTAVVAAALLGEARTRSWYAALGCGVLAVVMANGHDILEFLRRGA